MSPRRLAALAVALAAAVHAPAVGAAVAKPDPGGRAAILVDARTGDVLLEENAAVERPIASATKLMTALLTLERTRPEQVFVAAPYRASPIESKINLRRGERMRVDDLLEALLLESANDAAVTLAENIAPSRKAFVALMNSRARELGLEDTSYANPIGFDDPANHSSARDLATLARRLLANPLFARIVDLPVATLETGARERVVRNRNRLIARVPFVNGVKTGRTRGAGYVLVGSATGRGATVVSVVLGEPSESARDADTLALLRYGLDQFRRVPVLRAGRELARADVRWHDGEVALASGGSFALTVRRGERPRAVVDVPEELEGPLAKGERVGTVRVTSKGRTVHTAPVLTAEEVPGAGLPRRISSTLGGALTLLLALGVIAAAGLGGLRLRAVRRSRARA
ncbi:MAG TPA: D-alanyl-D-alanine carboxypeptidase family protein [Thermoleophilaceae bacterium]|nr:D-alanyl-D-alanine carboxypeptidase family protein [Thermoleophilaceae bacterium]